MQQRDWCCRAECCGGRTLDFSFLGPDGPPSSWRIPLAVGAATARPDLHRRQIMPCSRVLSRREAFQILQSPHRILLTKHPIIYAASVERCSRLIGELLEIRKELLDLSLNRHKQPDVPREELDRPAT